MPAKYTAEFEPQAWQNDYANPVDPEGETSWDCTAFVTNPPDWCKDYFTEAHAVGKELHKQGGVIDNDDVLKNDPAAPQWVRDWTGPFTITVAKHDPIAEFVAEVVEGVGGPPSTVYLDGFDYEGDSDDAPGTVAGVCDEESEPAYTSEIEATAENLDEIEKQLAAAGLSVERDAKDWGKQLKRWRRLGGGN